MRRLAHLTSNDPLSGNTEFLNSLFFLEVLSVPFLMWLI